MFQAFHVPSSEAEYILVDFELKQTELTPLCTWVKIRVFSNVARTLWPFSMPTWGFLMPLNDPLFLSCRIFQIYQQGTWERGKTCEHDPRLTRTSAIHAATAKYCESGEIIDLDKGEITYKINSRGESDPIVITYILLRPCLVSNESINEPFGDHTLTSVSERVRQ